jgi:SAM-dependent methyltransferase
MAGWDDGYVSDVVYTSNFHRETTPTWLAAAALLLGHRPPDLARPFHYADLGCGHGLTAIVVAATFPHAEVWGFDFNPAHVESARELASRAGLTNIRFHETSFEQLAQLPASALPEFDFMAAHGILSWVSRENQQRVVDVVGQRLRAGGLAYLSYNVATGWGALPPVRALMRMLMLSAGDRSDRSAAGLLDYLATMNHAGAAFFAANPSVEQRLNEIRQQDPRYIAHEFLNQDWHPLMFADVADRMAAAKCDYIGSATLAENVDAVSVPQGMLDLIAHASGLTLRETVRDFAAAQAFRRDIYRRGLAPIPAPEHLRMLDALPLEWLGQAVGDPISLPTPLGTLSGLPEIYAPLVAMLTSRTCTIGEIRGSPAFASRALSDLLQAVTLLVSAGFVHPAPPPAVVAAAQGCTDRLNAAIGAMNANGFDIGWLASPAIGSALKVDLMEALVVHESIAGQPTEIEVLTDRVLATLGRLGGSVRQDDKIVTDPAQARAVLRAALTKTVDDRLPILARLGVVARGS